MRILAKPVPVNGFAESKGVLAVAKMFQKIFLAFYLVVVLAGVSALQISGLPDVRIEKNSGYSDRLIDLWDYTTDNEPISDLYFSIESETDTSLIDCKITDNRWFECYSPETDLTGQSYATIMVEDNEGNTDTDLVRVEVTGTIENNNPECSEIRLDSHVIEVNENTTSYKRLTLENTGGRDFEVQDVTVYDYSDHMDIYEDNSPDAISDHSSAEEEIRIRTYEVSYDRTETGYIRVRGEFRNGRSCDKAISFSVRIRNSGQNAKCSQIRINASEVTVSEDSEEYETFTIENNSEETFNVDALNISENSTYFNAYKSSAPQKISPDSSATFRVRIASNNVSSTKKGTVNITMRGRFSGSTYCSETAISKESFEVTVKNDDDSEQQTAGEGRLEIMLANPAMALKAREEGETSLRLINNADEAICASISAAPNSSYVSAELEKNNVCIDKDSSRTITVKAKAEKSGNYTIAIEADYDEKTVKEILAIKAEEPKSTVGGSEITIASSPWETRISENESRELEVTIVNNTQEDMLDAKLIFYSLPSGINEIPGRAVAIRAGSIGTVKAGIENVSAKEGNYSIKLAVSYGGGKEILKASTISVPADEVKAEEAQEGGLVSLANSFETALLFIAAISAVVVAITLFLKRRG